MDPYKQTYGYGWIINEAFGKKQFFHGGGINGFATSIMRFPEEMALIIVLSNLETTNAYKIGSDLTAILFNQKYELAKLRTVASIDTKIYASYAGEYELAPGFTITVSQEKEKLMAQATGQGKFEIYPETETKFFYKVVDAQISFIKNDKSEVSHLILYQNGQEITVKRIK
ncbi:serine hydrolase [Rhodocytophaga rosea]|uniref:Serine hydrolase n=2 Tax=Rhodocytophaga rosea TaxID=2704465 RepID=A0A6C0GS28_9BACT|nr:serine hydrolase [Rhodocytophaga rosea]